MTILYEGQWKGSIGASILIDDEYILLTSAPGGDLYKLYLEDNHMEFLNNMSEIDFFGKTFGCALRKDKKIYFISLYNCYEIIEYDLESSQLKALYRREYENIRLSLAFLFGSKIYIFPEKLNQDICIYSIQDSSAEYISWMRLIGEVDVSAGHRVYFMECWEDILYGGLYNTNYLFEIKTNPYIQCTIHQLNNAYKIGSINIYQDELYITLLNDEEKLICMHKSGRIDEIELLHEGKKSEDAPFLSTIVYKGKIFLIPGVRNDRIQVVDQMTGQKQMLEYPDGFFKRWEGRTFWQSILVKNKLYLTHCEVSGLVILDLDTCKMEYLDYWIVGIKQFLKEKDLLQIENVQEMKNCGEMIYHELS